MGMNNAVQLKSMITPFIMDDWIQELCVDGISDTGGVCLIIEHEVCDVGYSRPEILGLAKEGTAAFRRTASDGLLNLVEGLRREGDFHNVERVAIGFTTIALSAIVKILFHNLTNKNVNKFFMCKQHVFSFSDSYGSVRLE